MIIHEGERLKKIVEVSGVKRDTLQNLVGLTTDQSLNYYFRKPQIKRSQLEKFCQALGISIDQFYHFENLQTTITTEPEVPPKPALHQGEALKKHIEGQGLKKNEVSEQLNVSRATLYSWFEKEELDESTIYLILAKMVPPPEFLLGQRSDPSLNTLLMEIRALKSMLFTFLEKSKVLQPAIL